MNFESPLTRSQRNKRRRRYWSKVWKKWLVLTSAAQCRHLTRALPVCVWGRERKKQYIGLHSSTKFPKKCCIHWCDVSDEQIAAWKLSSLQNTWRRKYGETVAYINEKVGKPLLNKADFVELRNLLCSRVSLFNGRRGGEPARTKIESRQVGQVGGFW